MDQDLAFHYVCTRDEAWDLVREHRRFWVSNCGCREGRGRCARSRVDVCLLFREAIEGSGGTGKREISLAEVEDIFREAREKHLVTRPFRNEENRRVVEGICFCCDDCCGYFLDESEVCDRGKSAARTDAENCTDCGLCADVCYFGAREMVGGRLVRHAGSCYGCGLCVDVCSVGCVEMTLRT